MRGSATDAGDGAGPAKDAGGGAGFATDVGSSDSANRSSMSARERRIPQTTKLAPSCDDDGCVVLPYDLQVIPPGITPPRAPATGGGSTLRAAELPSQSIASPAGRQNPFRTVSVDTPLLFWISAYRHPTSLAC